MSWKLEFSEKKKFLDRINEILDTKFASFDEIIDKCKKGKIISTVSEIPKINNEIIKKVFLTNNFIFI